MQTGLSACESLFSDFSNAIRVLQIIALGIVMMIVTRPDRRPKTRQRK